MAGQLINLGCNEKKVKIQHLGVGIEAIAFKPRFWEAGMPLRVLIAASFREKKGIPYALEALGQVQRKVPLEITIIGDATADPRSQNEKQRILEVIQNEGLATSTRLLGFQPYLTLLDEAYKHHVFISPSVTASDGDTEGGAPVSLIDMIATGMPIISTTHCDIPEVARYGIEGWLANERDVSGLVNRLMWLTDHSNGWLDLVRAGRRHVALEFNAIKQGQRLGQIYKDLLDNGIA